MKKYIFALATLLALPAFGHEIEGVMMLKGSLKSDVRVNGIKSTCKVKVKDVKNLMEEDQFGNPAYKVKVDISLTGGDFLSNKRVKFEKEIYMTNLFADGVRDLEYANVGIHLFIKNDGRLDRIQIPYNYGTVTCQF